MVGNKRRTSRVQVNYPVTMQLSEETIRGEMKNLSSGGACIDCEKPLAPGGIFDMSIHLQDRAISPSIQAQVILSSSHGMGVKFLPESDWTNPLEK